MTGMFDWISFDKGKARFCGGKRGGDDARHEVFAVQFEGPTIYYGELDLIFASDHNHFNIQIVSFGYGSAGNVANPSPTARATFSPSEIEAAKSVITDLMMSYRIRQVPIAHMPSYFLGEVLFRNGWVRAK